MEIKPQPNTNKKQQPKKSGHWWDKKEEPVHCRFIRDMFPSDNDIKQLCYDGVDWARKHPRAIKMKQFYDLKGITENQWDNLVKTNPFAATAHYYMVQALGNRRELNMLEGKYREHSNMHMMHQYDKDWDAANRYHVDLKKLIQEVVADELKRILVERVDTSNGS